MTVQPISATTLTGRAETLRAELANRIVNRMQVEGKIETGVPGFFLYRRNAPSDCISAAYEPELVVFVQGEKRINLGRTVHVCTGANFLLTSIDLPVVSQVIKATVEEPIAGVTLALDMARVREILSQQEITCPTLSGTRGMAVGTHTPELLDACLRLVDLLDRPQDISFLGPLIQREIIYRLLCSPQGGYLRSIATLGEQSHRTAKAVSWLRSNYSRPLRVEELAAVAQMGVSTLHHHFRALTAMSPLQYQKQLRLHVARERMLHEGLDAASAAFEVGYESASQFNREYSRAFGVPPMRDIKSRRENLAVSA